MSIEKILETRFPGDGLRHTYRNEIIRVCKEFMDSGMADGKYYSELSSDADEKFWACVSEALVYQLIKNKEFADRKVDGAGPDFLLLHNGKRIWVEVVCPRPIGIPGDWLSFTTVGAGHVPHDQILLRWTGAIKEKLEKLMGSSSGAKAGYIEQGIVSESDAYVIAVNGCQLRHGPFPALDGISQFPYAVEAVFPIGPRQLRIDRASQRVVSNGYQERHTIAKPNGAQVPAYAFLDTANHMVSAIWALDLNGGTCIGNSEPMAVVHNPNATNPLPIGYLPAEREFGAKRLDSDEYDFMQY